MDKLLGSKSVRVLSVLLAVLLVINIMPSGMDKILRAKADGESDTPEESEFLNEYRVQLVNDKNVPLPVSGIIVTMTAPENNQGNDLNNGKKAEKYSKTAVTDENGTAVFSKKEDGADLRILADREYNISFYENGNKYISSVKSLENVKVDRFLDEEGNELPGNLSVVVETERLKPFPVYVRIKNGTGKKSEELSITADNGIFTVNDGSDMFANSAEWENDGGEEDAYVKFCCNNAILGKDCTFSFKGDNTPVSNIAQMKFNTIDLLKEEPLDYTRDVSSKLTLKTYTVRFDSESLKNAVVYDISDQELEDGLTDREIYNNIKNMADNGDISPMEELASKTYYFGEKPAFLVEANDGYRILETTDGDEVYSIFKLYRIDKDESVTIKPVIKQKDYTVSFSIGENGNVWYKESSEDPNNIGGNVEIEVTDGDKVTDLDKKKVYETHNFLIKVKAKENYHIKEFSYRPDKMGYVQVLDELKAEKELGQNEPHEAEKLIENVHNDYEIRVTFTLDQFFIQTPESDCGELSVVGSQDTAAIRAMEHLADDDCYIVAAPESGGDVTLRATPNKGYHISYIRAIPADNSKEIINIYENEDSFNNTDIDLRLDNDLSLLFDLNDITSNMKIEVSYSVDETLPSHFLSVTAPFKQEYVEKINDAYLRNIYSKKQLDSNIVLSYNITNEITDMSVDRTGIRISYTDYIGSNKVDVDDYVELDTKQYVIDNTKRIKNIAVYYNRQWHNITPTDKSDTADLLFVIDDEAPVFSSNISKYPNTSWTNENKVTFSGKVSSEDYKDLCAKPEYIVWSSRPEQLSADEIIDVIESGNKTGKDRGFESIDSNGVFNIEIKDEQLETYSFYAVDEAKNIRIYNGALSVGIDTTAPDIDYFYIVPDENTMFDEFGVTAEKSITVEVTASDNLSGITDVTLICNYGDNAEDVEFLSPENLDELASGMKGFTARFVVDAERFDGKEITFSASATDAAGNTMLNSVFMSQENSNNINGKAIIGAPNVKANITPPEKCVYKDTARNIDCFNENSNIIIGYDVSDDISGLSGFDISIRGNGKSATLMSMTLNNEFEGGYIVGSYPDDAFAGTSVERSQKGELDLNEKCKGRDVLVKDGKLEAGIYKVSVIGYSRTKQGSTYKSAVASYTFRVDTETPKVTDMKITKVQTSSEVVLNLLSFGLFGNGNVEAEIFLDDGDASTSAGYQSVKLYRAGETEPFAAQDNIEAYAENAESTAKSVKIKIPANGIKGDDLKVYFSGRITAKVADNAEHESASYTPINESVINSVDEYGNVKPENDLPSIMIENIPPVISDITVNVDTYKDVNDETFDYSKMWYSKDVGMTVSAQDGESGVGKVQAYVNGAVVKGGDGSDYLFNSISSDKAGSAQLTDSFTDDKTVKTNGIERQSDGRYDITVTAKDNAGNKAKEKSLTIYKDTYFPTVTQFVFDTGASGSPNGDVFLTEYGYFFRNDTTVTVHTEDTGENNTEPSSGVNKVYFKAVPVGAKIEDTPLTDGDGKRVNKDGTASFVVPANFKGQILAYASDNVGNTTEKFVTPDGTILETQSHHDEEGSHIVWPLPGAPAAAADGTPLYAGEVTIPVTINDFYAGIESVEVTIDNSTETVTIDNSGKLSKDNWDVRNSEYNLVYSISKNIVVSGNKNDISLNIVMKDRAGNVTEESKLISIDTAPPTVKIEWRPNNENVTRETVYADIYVTDVNFANKNFVPTITNTLGTVPSISGWTNVGNNTYRGTIAFSSDGDYTFSGYAIDDVGNKSGESQKKTFTVDKTAPTIRITYKENNGYKGSNYFSKGRDATIEITDRNFAGAEIKGTANDNGKQITFPTDSGFKETSKDVNTATIKFKDDGFYTFTVTAKDGAGNSANGGAAQAFYVDLKAPEITFPAPDRKAGNDEGVEDQAAYKDDIIMPVVVFSDNNYSSDGTNVSLKGARTGSVKNGNSPSTVASDGKGSPVVTTYKYDNIEEHKDDLYTLKASTVDKAGNSADEEITFSVNREGSVYTIEEATEEQIGPNRFTNQEFDVSFTETNVDSMKGIQLTVIKNNTPITLSEGTDYKREEGNDGKWKQNKYTVFSKVFSDSGIYEVRSYSKDTAGNENENYKYDEGSKIISFNIDKIEPTIINSNFNAGDNIKSNDFNAIVEIKDNMVLDKYECYVDGQAVTLKPVNAKKTESDTENTDGETTNDTPDIETTQYTFTIPASTERHDIKLVALDRAGNEQKLEFMDNDGILVSTNSFILFLNNTPMLIGVIIVAVVLIAGIAALIVAGVKKKKKKK